MQIATRIKLKFCISLVLLIFALLCPNYGIFFAIFSFIFGLWALIYISKIAQNKKILINYILLWLSILIFCATFIFTAVYLMASAFFDDPNAQSDDIGVYLELLILLCCLIYLFFTYKFYFELYKITGISVFKFVLWLRIFGSLFIFFKYIGISLLIFGSVLEIFAWAKIKEISVSNSEKLK